MEIPQVSSYGDYSSDNYGVHTLQIKFSTFTLYYSYQTIVAYRDEQDGLVCTENDWGVTTGKHLNWIQPNHKKRVSSDEFDFKLQEMLKRHIQ